MNPQSITDMLAPLRSPDAVSWWPPAPGWWLLAVLVMLAVLALGRWLWRFHRRGAPLRRAKAELRHISADDAAADERLARLAVLQRRIAMRIAGRRACAGLTGERWIGFLNELAGTEEPIFNPSLGDLPYRTTVSHDDLAEVVNATQRWLGALERPR